jgi:CRP/FNR family cyclic AMP-dependent transcriptional regulator
MAVEVDALRGISFLAPLKDRALKRVASEFKEHRVAEGEAIVEQGSTGVGFFVILDGEVSVNVDGSEVRRLGRGDHFGEIALVLPQTPRSATVRALTPVRVGTIAEWNFRGFVSEHPEVHWPLLQTLAEQLASRPA